MIDLKLVSPAASSSAQESRAVLESRLGKLLEKELFEEQILILFLLFPNDEFPFGCS